MSTDILTEACDLLSALSRTRAADFFRAWFTEEKGHVPWDATNNPFNISGPIAPMEPWSYGIVSQEPNAVVVYANWQIGVMASFLCIQNVFPQVLEAATDADACLALNQPGRFGGTWAQNPQYGEEVASILASLQAVPEPTPAPAPSVPKTWTVQRGEYIDLIAQKSGVPAATILALNPNVHPPYYHIYPRQVLKLS